MKDSNICIKYGIDRNTDKIYADINIVKMEDDLQEVDAVVVTAITFYEEIVKQLESKMKCPIISLEDILYEV